MRNKDKRLFSKDFTLLAGALVPLLMLSSIQASEPDDQASCRSGGSTKHILFVGDSFTHGRYLPVRTYNNTPVTGGIGSVSASAHVVDDNFNTKDKDREENANEAGPWGGIPGIFSELAEEAGLRYDVHIEAISATTLKANFEAAQRVIVRPRWDSVVLQEATFEPIPKSLSGNERSAPDTFYRAVRTIEEAVHTAAPSADVYLYETGAPADTAYACSNPSGKQQDFDGRSYLRALKALTGAYHDAYLEAARRDPRIAGVAATGDSWQLAWDSGVADPDPFNHVGSHISLTFNYQENSDPRSIRNPESAGFHHPSVYGAYLNGLVLFQKITGTDVRTFGRTEKAARELGIEPEVAAQLQDVAWRSVKQQSSSLVHPDENICKVNR